MSKESLRARRNTIGDAVRRSARRYPEKEAIIFTDRRWTYSELAAAANRVANSLVSYGFAKGDRIAAYAMNSDAYMLLWLGCVKAGMIHVPVNFALKNDELLYILNQSGSCAVFSDYLCGSEEQKREWLPKMARMEKIGAFALTEPEVASGIAGGMTTTARRDGILIENDVARYFADAEAIYSYEGTREINALIVGRAATGYGAFV